MFTLLEKHIATTIGRSTVVTLLVIVMILMVFGLIDEMDDVGVGNYDINDALLVAMLAAPRHIFEVFPVAVLIGSLVGLGGLASQGELVAMRAAGMSIRDIIVAIIKTGMIMVIFAFVFGDYVAPASERYSTTLRATEMQQKITLESEYGFWEKDGAAFTNIRTILPGGDLRDIYIYEFNDRRQLTLATYAQSAAFVDDGWVLRQVSQTEIIDKVRTSTRQLEEAQWNALLDPDLVDMLVIRPGMMPVIGLYQYLSRMNAGDQAAREYEVAFWAKIGIPFATMVMVFLAVPFVVGHQQRGEKGQRIFLGIVLGMSFYLLNRAMSYIALVWAWDPLLAAAMPSMLFLVLGIFMLRRAH